MTDRRNADPHDIVPTMACWAETLGNCSGGISREHIISASQFDTASITVVGLPWCPEPKSVGLASLVAKNLCRHHNTELSPSDREAARFKRRLDDIHTPGALPVRVSVDARLIEQWLLKTTINLTLQEPGSGLDVTPQLVRRAFRIDPTPPKRGFFLVVEKGEQVGDPKAPVMRFETLRRTNDGAVVMALFVLHGWRALYAFDGAPVVRGAFRPRRADHGASWLRFRWRPAFAPDDELMR